MDFWIKVVEMEKEIVFKNIYVFFSVYHYSMCLLKTIQVVYKYIKRKGKKSPFKSYHPEIFTIGILINILLDLRVNACVICIWLCKREVFLRAVLYQL